MSEIILPPAGTHARFVELLGDLDVIVWEMDAATWNFTYVSERAERITGYPLARWYEEPTFWQDVFLHPDDSPWCVHFCSTATRECRNHAFLYRARKADGSVIWIKDLVRVLPDAGGMARVMRGVMLDVTAEMVGDELLAEATSTDYDAPEHAALRRILEAA